MVKYSREQETQKSNGNSRADFYGDIHGIFGTVFGFAHRAEPRVRLYNAVYGLRRHIRVRRNKAVGASRNQDSAYNCRRQGQAGRGRRKDFRKERRGRGRQRLNVSFALCAFGNQTQQRQSNAQHAERDIHQRARHNIRRAYEQCACRQIASEKTAVERGGKQFLYSPLLSDFFALFERRHIRGKAIQFVAAQNFQPFASLDELHRGFVRRLGSGYDCFDVFAQTNFVYAGAFRNDCAARQKYGIHPLFARLHISVAYFDVGKARQRICEKLQTLFLSEIRQTFADFFAPLRSGLLLLLFSAFDFCESKNGYRNGNRGDERIERAAGGAYGQKKKNNRNDKEKRGVENFGKQRFIFFHIGDYRLKTVGLYEDTMDTKILSTTSENIKLCAKAVKNGELVAFPTETVYGLGANALDATAAEKIYAAKGRPSDNPLIVHVASMNEVSAVVEKIPPIAVKLAAAFMPGPLTLVMKKKPCVPDTVTGGLDTVAVRIPKSSTALSLIRAAGVPICAPSANLSGRPSPTTARHVYNDLYGKIPYILDGGACKIGIESTVLDLTSDKPRLLRPGGLSPEKLRDVAGEIEIVQSGKVALCPGMKYKHYAPKAEVLFSAYYENMAQSICDWYDKLSQSGKKPVILCLSQNAEKYGDRATLKVGRTYEDYAHNLFADLRLADDRCHGVVIAEGVEDGGIGSSLINRLVKSSGGRII